MAVTATLYNNTVYNFVDGVFQDGHTYRINLYSAFTPDVTDTTLTEVHTGATQIATANGYTQNSKQVGSVAFSVTGTNDAKLDAADVTWTATTGPIPSTGTATHALIYDDTVTNDPPVMYIAFGTGKKADAGTDFKITWATGGLIRFTYT